MLCLIDWQDSVNGNCTSTVWDALDAPLGRLWPPHNVFLMTFCVYQSHGFQCFRLRRLIWLPNAVQTHVQHDIRKPPVINSRQLGFVLVETWEVPCCACMGARLGVRWMYSLWKSIFMLMQSKASLSIVVSMDCMHLSLRRVSVLIFALAVYFRFFPPWILLWLALRQHYDRGPVYAQRAHHRAIFIWSPLEHHLIWRDHKPYDSKRSLAQILYSQRLAISRVVCLRAEPSLIVHLFCCWQYLAFATEEISPKKFICYRYDIQGLEICILVSLQDKHSGFWDFNQSVQFCAFRCVSLGATDV